MKGKKIIIRRKFTEEFKLTVVREYESGVHTVLEMSRLFGISETNIYNWIYKYSAYNKKKVRIVEMTESSSKKVSELQKRIKELESIVGQKQIKIDYLEKMMEIAQEQYGIDIKKNSDTSQSHTSGKTERR